MKNTLEIEIKIMHIDKKSVSVCGVDTVAYSDFDKIFHREQSINRPEEMSSSRKLVITALHTAFWNN